MITTEMLLEGFSPLFKILIILTIALSLLTILKGIIFGRRKKKVKLEYSKHKSILTNNELCFYRELKNITEKRGYVLMSKVRMADIITPKKGTRNYMSLFAKISQKHADFVLCDRISLEPVLVIELDDKTHERADRKERDIFVNQAYKLASLPILHVRNSNNLESKIIQSI